jgi:hypothetical protein
MSKALEQEASKVGAAVARALFNSRGNNSEIHLRETQLAELCSLAYQSGFMAAAKLAMQAAASNKR